MSEKLPLLDSIGESIRPITTLKHGIDPGTMIGVDDRPTDTRIVAVAIRVRAPSCRVGDREFSAGNLCMHEVSIAKRFYEEQGGSLAVCAAWPPNLARLVPMTQNTLEVEAARIFSTYLIPRENGPQLIANEYLGAEPGERLRRLCVQMEKQVRAWLELFSKAKARVEGAGRMSAAVLESAAYDQITDAELNAIVDLGDPAKDAVNGFVLPTIDLDMGAPAPTPVPKAQSLDDIKAAAEREDPTLDDDGFFDGLSGLDLSPDQLSAMIALLDGGRKPSMLTDDEIVRALGNKAKLKAVRSLIAAG